MRISPCDLLLTIWCCWKAGGEERGESSKLQQPFVGLYTVVESYPNYTYRINQQGQESIQNKCQLKLFGSSGKPTGQAQIAKELPKIPNMTGAVARKSESTPVAVNEEGREAVWPEPTLEVIPTCVPEPLFKLLSLQFQKLRCCR